MAIVQNGQYDPLNLTDGSDLDASNIWQTTKSGAAPAIWTFYDASNPVNANNKLGVYKTIVLGGPDAGTAIARAFATGAGGGKLTETTVTQSILFQSSGAVTATHAEQTWDAVADDIDVGLLMRATGITWGVDSWYELGITNLDTTTGGELLIRRVNAGSSTVLAHPTFASIDPTFSVPGKSAGSGYVPVKIVGICKNNGGSVDITVSVTQNKIGGKTISTSFSDLSGFRITAAGYGGFFGTGKLTNAASTCWLHFKEWLLLAEYDENGNPKNPPEASADDPDLSTEPVLSTIAIANEGTASTALPIQPTLAAQLSSEYVSVQAQMESLDTMTYAKFPAARRIFTLTWDPMKNADAQTLKDFYTARTGPIEPFNWTAPQYGSVKLIFEPGSYDEQVRSISTKAVTARVIEVF